jgi:hypothetical protein
MPSLQYFEEPKIMFGFEQAMQDARDGLTLFGPLDRARPEGIRWGVVGPRQAIARMKNWVDRMQGPIASGENLIARPIYPGFSAAFKTSLGRTPVLEVEIPDDELLKRAHCEDRHQRVYQTVSLYADKLVECLNNEDVSPDMWCVVVPEYVYTFCRPQSIVPIGVRIAPEIRVGIKKARGVLDEPTFFADENQVAEQYEYDVNFHHQLKARLLEHKVPTQIVRETTIACRDFCGKDGRLLRPLEAMESSIAWALSTAMFYKAGGRPWKLSEVREGVCYIGLVFKQLPMQADHKIACCAAQMFLDSGDGVVFKGAVGPWYRDKPGEFHLTRDAARQVVAMCIDAYQRLAKMPPKEIFIHGRVFFDDDEWVGFRDACGSQTKVIGVRIRPSSSLKLFRCADHPVLRGLAYTVHDRRALLWTRGMIPRLRTYPGREVPNPIQVEVCRGQESISVVLKDILALTKLNYNACAFADGLPVTLKFANAVGEILTAAPESTVDVPPLAFKYYI